MKFRVRDGFTFHDERKVGEHPITKETIMHTFAISGGDHVELDEAVGKADQRLEPVDTARAA